MIHVCARQIRDEYAEHRFGNITGSLNVHFIICSTYCLDELILRFKYSLTYFEF